MQYEDYKKILLIIPDFQPFVRVMTFKLWPLNYDLDLLLKWGHTYDGCTYQKLVWASAISMTSFP